MLSSKRDWADTQCLMKVWMTDEERAELRRREGWTQLHALAVIVGLVALIFTAVLTVLPQ